MNTTREAEAELRRAVDGIDDDWGRCFECGCEDRGIELLMAPCPRCAELAALEREIGRAMLYEDLASNAAERVIQDDDACYILYGAANEAMMATIPLIARYRALLAAGAEAAQGGEEA